MDRIALATGYEIEKVEGWEDHLVNALIDEMFTRTVKREGYGVDGGLRLLYSECDRIGMKYGISHSELMSAVTSRLDLDQTELDEGATTWVNGSYSSSVCRVLALRGDAPQSDNMTCVVLHALEEG